MTTKKAKEKVEKQVGLEEYKHDNDDKLEDEKVETPESLPEKELEKVKDSTHPLDSDDLSIKHFDPAIKEFLEKIEKIPVLTDDLENKILKHYSDKKGAWIFSHVNDEMFPIRFKKIKESKDKDYIRYETEEEKLHEKTFTKFVTEEKFFAGGSLTPAHRDNLNKMEREENMLITRLDIIQSKLNNVITIRNTIAKLTQLASTDDPAQKRLTIEELKSYLKKLTTAIEAIPKDADEQIKNLQEQVYARTSKKLQFLAYAYLTIDEDDYPHALNNDIRDYIAVLRKREDLRVPT